MKCLEKTVPNNPKSDSLSAENAEKYTKSKSVRQQTCKTALIRTYKNPWHLALSLAFSAALWGTVEWQPVNHLCMLSIARSLRCWDNVTDCGLLVSGSTRCHAVHLSCHNTTIDYCDMWSCWLGWTDGGPSLYHAKLYCMSMCATIVVVEFSYK